MVMMPGNPHSHKLRVAFVSNFCGYLAGLFQEALALQDLVDDLQAAGYVVR